MNGSLSYQRIECACFIGKFLNSMENQTLGTRDQKSFRIMWHIEKSIGKLTSLLFAVSILFTTSLTAIEQKSSLEIPLILSTENVLRHTGYSLVYSEKDEQAKWVAYILTKDQLEHPVATRDKASFIIDPSIKTGSAKPSDYLNSGYDRGHLCPAADNKWSLQAMKDSFYMSNMSPQMPALNRNVWSQLEEQVRQWAIKYGTVYVATGPILTGNNTHKHIGKEEVTVPDKFYKVILVTGTHPMAIGYVIPNQNTLLPFEQYQCSVNEVEMISGINFFPALPDNIEERVESAIGDFKQPLDKKMESVIKVPLIFVILLAVFMIILIMGYKKLIQERTK